MDPARDNHDIYTLYVAWTRTGIPGIRGAPGIPGAPQIPESHGYFGFPVILWILGIPMISGIFMMRVVSGKPDSCDSLDS